MNKLVSFLLISFFGVISCNQNKNKYQQEIAINKQYSDILNRVEDLPPINVDTLYNRVFYKITQTDSMDILYHPCDASINTIKITENFIYEDMGQEDIEMYYSKINKEKDTIFFVGKDEQYKFYLLNVEKGYWKIDDKIFIDSSKIDNVAEFWEPYKKCWGDEAFEMSLSMINQEQTNPIGYLNLGDLYWEKGDYSKAKDAYSNYIMYMKLSKKGKKISEYVYKRLELNK
ncbi:hypothetical protein [Capnocytophaga cynodegmi]|uniref:hypothetical protein n=1 Tax=Capnocytophaga cynodegmi TaxID=28189 RepID=UPI00385AAF43